MDRKRALMPAVLLIAALFFHGTAGAEDVVFVKFPQGELKACSSPATGSYTVRGPGKVTTVITLNPYKILGFSPNIPVGFRPLGSDNRFMMHHLLPNAVGGKATQLGQEVEHWRDNVPIELSTIYQLTDDKEYSIEVMASPQCRMLYQGTYWQEGQEVRFSVISEGAKVATSPYKPPPAEPPPPPPVADAVPSSALLTSKVWQFGRSDGTVLVSKMRLLPDGRIEGAANPNESRWALVGSELLFYDAAGKVSTRYNTFKKDGGRWVISGPFLLWGNITHVLKEEGGPASPAVVGAVPSSALLTSKVWQFGRSDGSVLVSRMRLLSDGRIEGAAHPNESKWAVAGSELLFYDAAGKVSTRYNNFQKDGGRWVISGPFLLWGNITHVLKEVE